MASMLLYLAYSSASTHPLFFHSYSLILGKEGVHYIIALTVWFMGERTSEKGVFRKKQGASRVSLDILVIKWVDELA